MSGNSNAAHGGSEPAAPVQMGSERSFGLVFAAVFAIVGLLPIVRGNEIRWWAVAIAGIFLIVALAAPKLLRPLNRIWFAFGLVLHKIITPVVMGALFFGAITPLAWLSRRCGKTFLPLRREPAVRSYWIVREPPGPAPESMKNQY